MMGADQFPAVAEEEFTGPDTETAALVGTNVPVCRDAVPVAEQGDVDRFAASLHAHLVAIGTRHLIDSAKHFHG